MTTKSILIALAHPDDEAFALGGLIGKYVSEGADVYYILGTRGNRGTVSDEYIEKHGSIEAVREYEMNCATEVLGFKEVFKLGYGDSGMMGTTDNEDPECLWQQDPEVVCNQIREIMLQVQPQIVICDNQFGGYGHPDHIYMHRATTQAFESLQDHPDYHPQKLYYTTFRSTGLRRRIWLLRLQGKNPRKRGRNKDIDMLEIRDNIPPHHAKINVSKYREIWHAASDCHASQLGERAKRNFIQRWWQKREPLHQLLYRQYPAPNGTIEHDIFAGVQ